MLVSKYRPKAMIIGVGNDEKTIRGLCMCRGIKSLNVPSLTDKDKLVDAALDHALSMSYVKR
jgi:pyruvate kinase